MATFAARRCLGRFWGLNRAKANKTAQNIGTDGAGRVLQSSIRYEQLVRYVGWYSSRSRGARAAKGASAVTVSSNATEDLSEFASRARVAWARLIRKVYEADPLACPKCKGPMRIIALIEDPAVVRAILTHLGCWQPTATERAPPVPPSAWPAHASLPLTYHPLPDIA